MPNSASLHNPPNQKFGIWTQSVVSARRRERVEDDLKGKDVERLQLSVHTDTCMLVGVELGT